MRNLLESQIISDANNGDTTVLYELLDLLTDEQIYNALSDVAQSNVKAYYDVHVEHESGGYSIGVVCPYPMNDEGVIKVAIDKGQFEEVGDSNLVDSVDEIDLDIWTEHFNIKNI